MATSLLNKAAVKRFLLDCSQELRRGKLTRVSAGVFDQIEYGVRTHCRKIVDAQARVGKTIQ